MIAGPAGDLARQLGRFGVVAVAGVAGFAAPLVEADQCFALLLAGREFGVSGGVVGGLPTGNVRLILNGWPCASPFRSVVFASTREGGLAACGRGQRPPCPGSAARTPGATGAATRTQRRNPVTVPGTSRTSLSSDGDVGIAFGVGGDHGQQDEPGLGFALIPKGRRHSLGDVPPQRGRVGAQDTCS